jgi:hypothetical protein
VDFSADDKILAELRAGPRAAAPAREREPAYGGGRDSGRESWRSGGSSSSSSGSSRGGSSSSKPAFDYDRDNWRSG